MKLSYLVGMFFQVKGAENMYKIGDRVVSHGGNDHFNGKGTIVNVIREGNEVIEVQIKRDDGVFGGGQYGTWRYVLRQNKPLMVLPRNVFQGERQMKHA